MAERFLWNGPESEVDAQIRKRSPLPKGWWFRSYIDHVNPGFVRLFEVKPETPGAVGFDGGRYASKGNESDKALATDAASKGSSL